ncbi:hypothetical protein BZA70DRAFT_270798 [Myxozyma melibiosi]|uniref:F-box domain-containing protein n=1 Tax=Myxozyma melibiosi TaxID=54550 RepID=A0ABR1FBM0_9ASCO
MESQLGASTAVSQDLGLENDMGALSVASLLTTTSGATRQTDIVQKFPLEIAEKIFEGFPLQTLVHLRLVCQSWNKFIMTTPSLWKYVMVDKSITNPDFLLEIKKGIESSNSQAFCVLNLEPEPTALAFKWPTDFSQLVYARITVVQSIGLVPLLARGHFPNLENLDFQEFSALYVSHESDRLVYDIPVLKDCVESLPHITELTICKYKARSVAINSELYNTIFGDGTELFQSPVICVRRLNRLLRLLPNLRMFKLAGYTVTDPMGTGDEYCEWEPSDADPSPTPDFTANTKLESVEMYNCRMRIMPIIPATCTRVALADTETVPQQRRIRRRTDGTTEEFYYPPLPKHDCERRMAVFETEYKNVETLEFCNIDWLTSKHLVSILTRTDGSRLNRLRLSACRNMTLGIDTVIDPPEIGASSGSSISLSDVNWIVKLCPNLQYLDLGNTYLGGVATDRALMDFSQLTQLRVLWLTLSMQITWFGIAAIVGEWSRYLAQPDARNLSELLKDVDSLPNCSLQVLDVSGCPSITLADVRCLRRCGLTVYYEKSLPAAFVLA